MNKNLFITALLCSISFAGKATTNEAKIATVVTKPMTIAKACRLYEMTYSCPNGAWSVQCYGYTQAEAQKQFDWLRVNADCGGE